MSIFKRGACYWYEFEFRGLRIRESGHTKNKEVCERLMRERRRKLELSGGGLKEVAKPKLFGPAAEAYLLLREPHWGPKTQLMHANSLVHLKPHFGKSMLGEIDKAQVSKYQRARLKDKASPRSINIEIALVRLVLRDAKLWQNIAGDVKMLEEESDIGRELGDDEAIRLLTACKASASRSLYPGVLVSIHTGLRSHELRLLRWRQVDLAKGTITVGKSKTKGGKGRLVYLSETAIQTLKNWKAQFPDAKPNHAVFPSEAYAMKGKKGTPGGIVASYRTDPNTPIGSWKRSWATAKKAAGVEARWQDLRHTAASKIAAGGATDQTLMALFGWMSPKMIERYSHVREEAKMRAVKVFDNPESLEGPPKNHHSEGASTDKPYVN